MRLEDHKKALDEHIRNLKKAIEEGIEENQRNIGYNTSQGSVELFAIFLHAQHVIEGSGDQWDHRTFKNERKIEQKVPLSFLDREKVLPLMKQIETDRNIICYGPRKPVARIEKMVTAFHELRRLVTEDLKKLKCEEVI